jgi:FKBP-type peptidyl-prolyl cis-trans isomerase
MRFFSFFTFFLGLALGSFLSWFFNAIDSKSLDPIDVSIGEVLFEELQNFPQKWNINSVTKVVEDLSTGKRKPQSQETRDKILIDLSAEESEMIAQENLKKGEAFLMKISRKENVKPIVTKMVYFEILHEGMGETIALNDEISVEFKQFDIEGNKIKDTENKRFNIFLPRTIKGFKLGMEGAKVGERRKIYIHPDYGFGKMGRGDASNQILIYEILVCEKVTPVEQLLPAK